MIVTMLGMVHICVRVNADKVTVVRKATGEGEGGEGGRAGGRRGREGGEGGRGEGGGGRDYVGHGAYLCQNEC